MTFKYWNFIFVFFILISAGFSINLSIVGNIEEYSSNYQEQIIINLNCNEDITLKAPESANNIFINNISSQNSSFFINNCINATTLKYNIAKVEKIDTYKYRIERKFNNLNNINYTYSLIVPITYSVNINQTFPKKYSVIIKDNKKEIIFEKNDLFLIYLNKNDLEDIKITPEHILEEIKELTVIILIIISFLTGVFTSYFYFKKTTKNLKESSVPSYILSKEEKEVIDIIKENTGINQKQIGTKLDKSKSKISSIVNDLEQKQLIRREKFGRSFKVYLNKKIH